MAELIPDKLDEPQTRSAMAKAAGISATTLVNWSSREQAPLITVNSPSGGVMYTWRHLLEFCKDNPNLHAAPQALRRYRSLGDAPSHRADGANGHLPSRAAALASRSRHSATIRSALQDLKTQVAEQSTAVAAALSHAEEVSLHQASLAQRLEDLEIAVARSSGAGN